MGIQSNAPAFCIPARETNKEIMSELVVLNNQTTIQQGGLGVDFGNSRLFQLKPASLFIVQSSSKIEGATKGSLRIAETGDEFKEMYATLLVQPTEQRQYHIGEASEMNRIPENLMCFCNNVIRDSSNRELSGPDPRAKIPQAMKCQGCARSSWDQWKEYKEKNNGKTSKALIPPCDAHYKALLIDEKYKLPLAFYVRSKGKEEFEQGMQNLARVIAMQQAEGKRPNIFDVRFKVSTKLVTKGQFSWYVPVFSGFTPVTDEQRQQFGAVYLQYAAQKAQQSEVNTQAQDDAKTSATNESVDASLVEGEYVGEDKEIVI